jgi:acetyltransferase-like isoleucine patch superfamily enzyme
MRPRQWIKNLFIFAPVLFARSEFTWAHLFKVCAAFVVLCLATGGIYILNDLNDAEADWAARFVKTSIGSNVAIGSNATILGGVTVGDGAMIGAGSVVTRSIPPGQVWAGNPARYMRGAARSA